MTIARHTAWLIFITNTDDFIILQVVMKNATRLCSTKPIVTVNGNFPGPTIVAREDDTVLVKVVNHVKYNVSIHW